MPRERMEKKEEIVGKVRCQRIGCDATFSEDDNPEGSCQYHDSGPIFHDGIKEWSCCKKKSHDFSLFLEIPGYKVRGADTNSFGIPHGECSSNQISIDAMMRTGKALTCKTGKHTTEKPVLTKAAPSPKKSVSAPSSSSTTDASSKETCSRCRQGFFCSDHGSMAGQMNSKPLNVDTGAPSKSNTITQCSPVPAKKLVGINEPQTCKNKGCGKTFKEKDNYETACSYHPGPAVFHDRMRGWKCCDIHVKEFDEFMDIPPCTKGWHNADPSS